MNGINNFKMQFSLII